MAVQNRDRSSEEIPQSVFTGEFSDDLRIRGYQELAGSIRARKANRAEAADAMGKRGRELLADAIVVDTLAQAYTSLGREIEYWQEFDVDKFVKDAVAALPLPKDPTGGDHAS